MRRADLGARLERLPSVLTAPEFLAGSGIGNEIGFHIFAYDAKDEPIVSSYLPKLLQTLTGPAHGLRVLVLDLYRMSLDLLDARGVLDQAFELERAKGTAEMEKAIRRIVRPENLVALVRERIEGAEPDLIFMVGVGAAYPLVRSHTILNNLHAVVDRVPLVMFFPGSYDGQELRLFDTLKDDNYYRAFPLLDTVNEGDRL